MILADITPTLLQRLLFGAVPGPLVNVLYSLALIATVYTAGIGMIALLGIYAERKVAGHIQSRFGPNRVGPIGLLQSIADGIKLITKEDLRPAAADRVLFVLAPYLAFAPVFASFLAIPFAPDAVFESHLSVGIFWILAILSMEVIGIILAGWASNSKWSLYGGMRQACQMVCFEIPLGLSIIVGVMAAGTLDLIVLGHRQGGGLHTWLIFANPFMPLAFLAYFVASLASNKRAPFDLPESESELVAGYHTEYSGLRFSFFYFAEYAAMFVVAAIQVAMFLGAWNDPLGLFGFYYAHFKAQDNLAALLIMNGIGMAIFIGKVMILIFVQMWIRWTLPRPRIDQVLYASIKVLLPMTCLLLLGAALWGLMISGMPGQPWSPVPGLPDQAFNPWRWGHWRTTGTVGALVTQSVLAAMGAVFFLLIIGYIARAWWTGRSVRQRLTEPEPIPD